MWVSLWKWRSVDDNWFAKFEFNGVAELENWCAIDDSNPVIKTILVFKFENIVKFKNDAYQN